MNIKEFYQPQTLDEAYDKLNENPNNQVMGGGAWMKLSAANVDTLIQLGNLGLEAISETEDKLTIGSYATLRQVEKHKSVQTLFDGMLSQAIKSVMGVQIRNIATIGGTVMGRYPFSDIMTALLALKIDLVFYHQKKISLEEYLKIRKPEKDLLLFVEIAKENGHGYFRKVSKTALDFAILNVAITKMDDRTRITIGARPGLAELAYKAMELADSGPEATFDHIGEVAASELEFTTNSKASKEYRQELAKTYVKRGLKVVTDHES